MTFPFLVTIVFWAILSSPSTLSTRYFAWSNISVHALNTPFAIFEIFLTNTPPAPWITLPCGLLILGAYLGVAYITKADQNFYPYNFLNPHTQHARLAGWIIGIGVAYGIIFVLVRLTVSVRVRLTLFGRRVENESAEEKGEVMAIDEWVQVDSREQNSGERV